MSEWHEWLMGSKVGKYYPTQSEGSCGADERHRDASAGARGGEQTFKEADRELRSK
ncbi:hypothetical protein [Rhodanobacter sp. Soil772]|uniref:hypothetical protein n=1 Tax=Rhodanobacter sp. Soil772 TaxID=1736406 RepID=UPI0012F9545F|nr:hypothetical protein [Rhodanobacter sp. Soil772]